MRGSDRYGEIIEAIERNIREEGACRPIPKERLDAMNAAIERLRRLAKEEAEDGREG